MWSHMTDWGAHGGFGGWYFGAIPMLLWWALIIAGIVALVRCVFASGGGRRSTTSADPALTLLRERYARGEIDKEEFDRKRADLST